MVCAGWRVLLSRPRVNLIWAGACLRVFGVVVDVAAGCVHAVAFRSCLRGSRRFRLRVFLGFLWPEGVPPPPRLCGFSRLTGRFLPHHLNADWRYWLGPSTLLVFRDLCRLEGFPFTSSCKPCWAGVCLRNKYAAARTLLVLVTSSGGLLA